MLMLIDLQDLANLVTVSVSDHCHDHNNVKLPLLNNNNKPDQAVTLRDIKYKLKPYCHQAKLQQS